MKASVRDVDTHLGCRIALQPVVVELLVLALVVVFCQVHRLLVVKALCFCEYSVSDDLELAQGTACSCHRRVADFCMREVARI